MGSTDLINHALARTAFLEKSVSQGWRQLRMISLLASAALVWWWQRGGSSRGIKLSIVGHQLERHMSNSDCSEWIWGAQSRDRNPDTQLSCIRQAIVMYKSPTEISDVLCSYKAVQVGKNIQRVLMIRTFKDDIIDWNRTAVHISSEHESLICTSHLYSSSDVLRYKVRCLQRRSCIQQFNFFGAERIDQSLRETRTFFSAK